MTLGVGVIACGDDSLTYGGPLDLVVASNSPVAVSDSLVVEYDAQGRSLLGMEVTWGDATVDSVFFHGAQHAGGHVKHLYAVSGTYTVTAKVSDALEGSTSRDLEVTIDP